MGSAVIITVFALIIDADGPCKRSMLLTMRQLLFLFAQVAERALRCLSKRGILKAE